mgnify:CR=1 FL=1
MSRVIDSTADEADFFFEEEARSHGQELSDAGNGKRERGGSSRKRR